MSITHTFFLIAARWRSYSLLAVARPRSLRDLPSFKAWRGQYPLILSLSLALFSSSHLRCSRSLRDSLEIISETLSRSPRVFEGSPRVFEKSPRVFERL
eukprot:1044020-Amorphochlora_amoeboformis.AAC.1